MSKESKPLSGWQTWLNTLSPAARKALTEKPAPRSPDDEKEDYARWRDGLSEPAREAVDELVPTEEREEAGAVDENALRYCCVENTGEEEPVLRIFRTPEALARHLSKLDGGDVYVIPFLGVPLRFSGGPQRYLELPDGDKVMVVPHLPGGPCRVVDADLVDFDPQENFFLGPDELCDTTAFAEKMAKLKNAGTDVSDGTDEDDEDDEDDEEETVEP